MPISSISDAPKPDAPKAPAGKAVATPREVSPDCITVKSLLPDLPDSGAQIALWERDPLHPEGEVLLAGFDATALVYPTVLVNSKIRDSVVAKV